jgi:hypothetical protein
MSLPRTELKKNVSTAHILLIAVGWERAHAYVQRKEMEKRRTFQQRRWRKLARNRAIIPHWSGEGGYAPDAGDDAAAALAAEEAAAAAAAVAASRASGGRKWVIFGMRSFTFSHCCCVSAMPFFPGFFVPPSS